MFSKEQKFSSDNEANQNTFKRFGTIQLEKHDDATPLSPFNSNYLKAEQPCNVDIFGKVIHSHDGSKPFNFGGTTMQFGNCNHTVGIFLI